MNSPEDDSLEALRAHFANLRIGAISVYETTFYEEAVEEYARRAQIAYPGRYVERSGHKLVPPGMLFVGPAAVFGLRDGPRGAQGGIFTETMRRYHARYGSAIRYDLKQRSARNSCGAGGTTSKSRGLHLPLRG